MRNASTAVRVAVGIATGVALGLVAPNLPVLGQASPPSACNPAIVAAQSRLLSLDSFIGNLPVGQQSVVQELRNRALAQLFEACERLSGFPPLPSPPVPAFPPVPSFPFPPFPPVTPPIDLVPPTIPDVTPPTTTMTLPTIPDFPFPTIVFPTIPPPTIPPSLVTAAAPEAVDPTATPPTTTLFTPPTTTLTAPAPPPPPTAVDPATELRNRILQDLPPGLRP